MQFKSEEVNYLIYRYLLESGFSHSAFVFSHEALLLPGSTSNRGSGNGKSHDDSGFSFSKAADQVPAGALLTLMHKGLQYCDIQLHATEDGTLRPCGKAVSLLVPHVCSTVAATERQVKPSNQSVLGNQQGQATSLSQNVLPNQNVLGNQIPLPNQQLPNQITDQQTPLQPTTTAAIPSIPASSVIPLVGHTAEVYTCSWNPTKALLATGSGDSTARIWNLIEPIPSTGCQSIVLAAVDAPEQQQATVEEKLIITTLEWNPKGTLLAAGRSDGGCFVWDCAGTLVGHWKKHSASVFSIRWSPSGKWLLSGSEDSTVIVMAVSSSVDGERIQIDSASESDHSILSPMQIDSPATVSFSFHCSFSDHKGSVLDVDWEDENTFASCSQDATIRVFSLSSPLHPGSLVATLEGHAKEINAIKWSPHSHLLCSCSDDGTAKIWTSSTANSLPPTTTVEEGEEGEVGEDLGKKNAESTTDNPTLAYSRVRSYALLHTLAGHADGIYTVEWSPNSPSLLATASFDTTARLWNALEGTCIWVLAKHSKPVYSLAFSPDGLTLATGAVDKNVYFWDTERGKPLLAHSCRGGVYALGWSADGAGVAVCTAKSASFLAVRASSIAAK